MKTKEENLQNLQNDKHLGMLFMLLKKRDGIAFANHSTEFNSTEIRMLGEIVSAEYVGRRMISTQLAKALGVTRSAISQTVNRLEENGVVRRVPDEVDRKIAYIEITPAAYQNYAEALTMFKSFVDRVVQKFGEQEFEKLYEAYGAFLETAQKEKEAFEKELQE